MLSVSHTSSNQIKSPQQSDEVCSSAEETEAQEDTATCPSPDNSLSDRDKVPIQAMLLLLVRGPHTRNRCALGTSLAVQWLSLPASKAGSMRSIPGRGTKIPHTAQRGRRKRKNRCALFSTHRLAQVYSQVCVTWKWPGSTWDRSPDLEVLCSRRLFCPLAEHWVFLFLTPASFQGIWECAEFCKEKKADPFLHLGNHSTHHCTLHKIPAEKLLED